MTEKSLLRFELRALHYERNKDGTIGKLMGWSYSKHSLWVYEHETKEQVLNTFCEDLHNISNSFIHKFEIEYL